PRCISSSPARVRDRAERPAARSRSRGESSASLIACPYVLCGLVSVIPGGAWRQPGLSRRNPRIPGSSLGDAPEGQALDLRHLGTQTFLLLTQFGRQRLAEILRVEHLANFDLGAAVER